MPPMHLPHSHSLSQDDCRSLSIWLQQEWLLGVRVSVTLKALFEIAFIGYKFLSEFKFKLCRLVYCFLHCFTPSFISGFIKCWTLAKWRPGFRSGLCSQFVVPRHLSSLNEPSQLQGLHYGTYCTKMLRDFRRFLDFARYFKDNFV